MSSSGPDPGAVVAVVGATGRQGSAVVRHLLRDRWRVRALTREPSGAAARALADQGAQIHRVDTEDIGSLAPAFHGVHGIFNVQNPMTSSLEAEVRQGRHVAEAAAAAGVSHVVYGAAGIGEETTGVGSWDSKLAVAARFRDLGLRLTVLRPMAFMELMTDKTYYPSVGVWHVMPKPMGGGRPVGWLCLDDLGAITARVFADPDRWGDTSLGLVSDVQSIDACRALWTEVAGRGRAAFRCRSGCSSASLGPTSPRCGAGCVPPSSTSHLRPRMRGRWRHLQRHRPGVEAVVVPGQGNTGTTTASGRCPTCQAPRPLRIARIWLSSPAI